MLCIRVVCHEGEGRDWPAVRTSLRDDEKAHIEAGEDSGECVKIGDLTEGAVRRCRSNHAQSPCFLPTSVMPPGRSQGNCFRISERPPTASCGQLCQDEACGTSPTREIVVSSVLKDHPERWQMPISIRRARASTETLAHSSSQAFHHLRPRLTRQGPSHRPVGLCPKSIQHGRARTRHASWAYSQPSGQRCRPASLGPWSSRHTIERQGA